MLSYLMSSLPTVVFACDCLHPAMPSRHIEYSQSTLNLVRLLYCMLWYRSRWQVWSYVRVLPQYEKYSSTTTYLLLFSVLKTCSVGIYIISNLARSLLLTPVPASSSPVRSVVSTPEWRRSVHYWGLVGGKRVGEEDSTPSPSGSGSSKRFKTANDVQN